MSNVFKVTYFNGAFDHIKMELDNIEHVANQIFGKTVDELKSFGGNVEMIGEYVPEHLIPDVEKIPEDVKDIQTDITQVQTDAAVLTTAAGEAIPNPFAPSPPVNAVSEGASAQDAVVVPPAPVAAPPAPDAPPPPAA